ncbi:MAG: response regulator, partial [Sulfurimonas sp.]
MKFFWLISLLFSFAFGVDFQIITGAYSSEKSAIDEEKKLQRVMNQKKDFFVKHSIYTKYKQQKSYYLVTLEPFKDEETLATALKIIQKKYKGAYAFKLPRKTITTTPKNVGAIPEQARQVHEPIHETIIAPAVVAEENITSVVSPQEINNTKEINTTQEDVAVAVAEEVNTTEAHSSQTVAHEETIKTELPQNSDTSILTSAFLILSILIFIYLLFKRSQSKKEALVAELPQTTDTPEENKVDTVAIQKLQGEEGDFTAVKDTISSQESVQTLQKRKLIIHDKITKQDFKEFSGARILVAEDNLINQKVISGLLAESGIDVIIVNNGQEALDILQTDTNFTLIIMDAQMPIMGGIEATNAIRKNTNYNHIPIVALSGDTSESDIKKMLAAGMDGHLEKPLRIDALYDILYIYTEDKENQKYFTYDELNVEKGLETCAGDANFYHEILDEFVTTYSDSDTKIFEYLDNNELILADKYLLDLLGITSHIGADNLNKVIKKIKEVLKDTDEKSHLTLARQY